MPDIAASDWSERDDRNTETVPNGFPVGAIPSYADQVGRMMMGATKRWYNKANPVYLTTGTGDDYVVAIEGNTTNINLYEMVRVRIDRSNVGATPTLQYGNTSPRTIVKAVGGSLGPLAAGDMAASADCALWYNGTNYVLSNPAPASGSAYQPYSANLTSWAAVTRAAGYDTFAATPSSANLAALMADKTGTGSLVFSTSAVLVTPNLGTPSAVVLTNGTGLPINTGVSGLATGVATFLGTPSSANLRAALTDETGTGAAYFQNGALGTPASGTLTNCSGLPTTGLTGTLQAAQMPALTGDVTNTAGSLATTVANNAVSNAKLAQMAANTIKGNNTGSTANAADLTASQVVALINALTTNGTAQQITGGARITPFSNGTVTTGTLTPDPGNGPMQYYTNNGAHTLAPGTNKGQYTLEITNGASAGAITTSGFSTVKGDAFTTTNAAVFTCSVIIGQSKSTLIVVAN